MSKTKGLWMNAVAIAKWLSLVERPSHRAPWRGGTAKLRMHTLGTGSPKVVLKCRALPCLAVQIRSQSASAAVTEATRLAATYPLFSLCDVILPVSGDRASLLCLRNRFAYSGPDQTSVPGLSIRMKAEALSRATGLN